MLGHIQGLYKEIYTISSLEITDLGEIKYYLGVEITRNRKEKSLSLSQASFTRNLLKRFNKVEEKPAKTSFI